MQGWLSRLLVQQPQNNPVFMLINAAFKWEYLKIKHKNPSFCFANEAVHQGNSASLS